MTRSGIGRFKRSAWLCGTRGALAVPSVGRVAFVRLARARRACALGHVRFLDVDELWTIARRPPGRHARSAKEVITPAEQFEGGDASRRTTPAKNRNRKKVMPIRQMIQRRYARSIWIG